LKITNKDDRKAREYAMMYFIEQSKKKNPTFKLTKDLKVEIERYINGIISAQEFNEWHKSN
jgi:nucleoid DNA-binding protein